MKKMFFVIVLLVLLLVPTMAHGQVFGDINIHRVFFPQVAFGSDSGGEWFTTILAINTSNQPAQLTIGFTAQDGQNMVAPMIRSNGAPNPTMGHNPGDIPPGGGSWSAILRASEISTTSGAMVAMIPMLGGRDLISVQVTYGRMRNGRVESQATVQPSDPSRMSVVRAVRFNLESDSVGVAVTNPHFESAIVNMEIYDMDDKKVGTARVSVPPHGQIARFITDLVPELKQTWKGGKIIVTSDSEYGVATLGLQTTLETNGEFTFWSTKVSVVN